MKFAARYFAAAVLGSSPLHAPAAVPVTPTPAVEANYMLNCMGCHLRDGSGATGKVPSMRASLALLAANEPGRRYLVQVPGAAQSPLTDGELAQLLNWMVRSFSSKPAAGHFTEFTAAEVARYRATRLTEVRETRTRLLAAASGVH